MDGKGQAGSVSTRINLPKFKTTIGTELMTRHLTRSEFQKFFFQFRMEKNDNKLAEIKMDRLLIYGALFIFKHRLL